MTLTSAVARRVTVAHEVWRVVDELAAVRWANGTAPPDAAAWVALIQARAAEVGADSHDLAGEMLGLLADGFGLIESIVAEDAE